MRSVCREFRVLLDVGAQIAPCHGAPENKRALIWRSAEKLRDRDHASRNFSKREVLVHRRFA